MWNSNSLPQGPQAGSECARMHQNDLGVLVKQKDSDIFLFCLPRLCPPPRPSWILIQQFWGPELPTVASPKRKESFLIGPLGPTGRQKNHSAGRGWGGGGRPGAAWKVPEGPPRGSGRGYRTQHPVAPVRATGIPFTPRLAEPECGVFGI